MSGGQDKLPEGWESTVLDAVLSDVRNGTTADQNKDGLGVPVSRIEAVQRGRIDHKRIGYVSQSAGLERFLYDEGDIAFSHINSYEHVGKVGLITSKDLPLLAGMNLLRLRAAHGIDPAWLFWTLSSPVFRRSVRMNIQRSVNQVSINQKQIGNLPVLLPPSNEQLRIVAKLDALQVHSDAAKAALDAIGPLLEKFRQSVLAAAFRGDLTRKWREEHPDVEPASVLLERIRTERRRKWEEANPRKKYVEPEPVDTAGLPELPVGWCWATLEEVTENHDGRRIPVRREDRIDRQGEYPYYGASGIIDRVDNFLFDGQFLLIAEDGANLLTRSTPIAFQAVGKFWVNNHAHVVTTLAGMPLEHLEHFLNGISLQHYVTGSAQPKLTQKAMNTIAVPLAPLAEQLELARRVNAQLAVAKELLAGLESLDLLVKSLTQSILAKAFRGELVPQDPNDEPASVLLERIRREREGLGVVAGKRGRGRPKNP